MTALLSSIGVTVRDVLSLRSRTYQARRDEVDGLSDEALIREMVAEPTLLRRPILVGEGAHIIGAKNDELQHFVEEIQR